MTRTQEETDDHHVVDKKRKKKKHKKKKKEKKKDKKRRHEGAVSSKKRRRQEVSNEDESPKALKKSKKKLVFPEEKKDDGIESKKPKAKKTSTEEEDKKVVIPTVEGDDRIVQTSALDFTERTDDDPHNVTLLLFYQYVEPPWDVQTYHQVLEDMQALGDSLKITGRMRVAREGLNCTLTGSHEGILGYCKALRKRLEFKETEFKLTTDLPQPQKFPHLKVMPVTELVHYGLEKEKAPSLDYTGVHLQPQQYHEKLAQDDTVVIDVRNHYEAAIGRFNPPGAKWLDPKMRKSTEFPLWLDKESTKKELKGKQVLMYCTGGVRCERASALLKYKMETDPNIKDLNIQGVYQLQGGIDKYFKQFPHGGYWQGKNYTFDKRFAHAPPCSTDNVMGKCQVCQKPWDMYRGKRRCPTCGVPSLICRECFQADSKSNAQCELCVEEGVKSKAQLRQKEEEELQEYESKLASKPAANPHGVTRLYLKNMCRKTMDEATLMETIPGITHVVWKTDRKSGKFLGSAWVEMATPQDAARAVGINGRRVLGRPLYIDYQPPDGKDAWPPPSSKVSR